MNAAAAAAAALLAGASSAAWGGDAPLASASAFALASAPFLLDRARDPPPSNIRVWIAGGLLASAEVTRWLARADTRGVPALAAVGVAAIASADPVALAVGASAVAFGVFAPPWGLPLATSWSTALLWGTVGGYATLYGAMSPREIERGLPRAALLCALSALAFNTTTRAEPVPALSTAIRAVLWGAHALFATAVLPRLVGAAGAAVRAAAPASVSTTAVASWAVRTPVAAVLAIAFAVEVLARRPRGGAQSPSRKARGDYEVVPQDDARGPVTGGLYTPSAYEREALAARERPRWLRADAARRFLDQDATYALLAAAVVAVIWWYQDVTWCGFAGDCARRVLDP